REGAGGATSARPDRGVGRPQPAPGVGPVSGEPEVRPRGPRGAGGETVRAPAAVAAPPTLAPGSAEAGFLDRVSRALLLSALGAAALALLLSLLLTRYLARPLRELATAARRGAPGAPPPRGPPRPRARGRARAP